MCRLMWKIANNMGSWHEMWISILHAIVHINLFMSLTSHSIIQSLCHPPSPILPHLISFVNCITKLTFCIPTIELLITPVVFSQCRRQVVNLHFRSTIVERQNSYKILCVLLVQFRRWWIMVYSSPGHLHWTSCDGCAEDAGIMWAHLEGNLKFISEHPCGEKYLITFTHSAYTWWPIKKSHGKLFLFYFGNFTTLKLIIAGKVTGTFLATNHIFHSKITFSIFSYIASERREPIGRTRITQHYIQESVHAL